LWQGDTAIRQPLGMGRGRAHLAFGWWQLLLLALMAIGLWLLLAGPPPAT